MTRWGRRLFRFTSRSGADVADDVRDELQFHLEMRASDLEREGLAPAEARNRALREFGDVERASAAIRKIDGRVERQRGAMRLLAELRQDVTYGARLLVRTPAFSLTAILTLALAIGGNVALFSVVNALFLQPLPVRDPATLMRIYTGESRVSWPNLEDIRQRNTVFSALIGQRDTLVSLSRDPLPTQLMAGVVTTNYFDVLGVVPIAGRLFESGDTRADLVVLTERVWRAQFNATPDIVGQIVRLDDRPFEVVGILPRSFHSIAPLGFAPDVWIPADPKGAHAGMSADRGAARFDLFGRLRGGVAVEGAQAAMRVTGAQLAAEYPDVDERLKATEVYPAGGLNLYRGVGKTLLPVFVFIGFAMLLAAVVLLMSCANLAGLLLGRAAARRQEIAVRLAIGAGRGRLVRQLLTESLLLAALGALAGLGLASLITSGVSSLATQLPFPTELNLAPDVRVLAYTIALTFGCAVLFGLAPARRASALQLTDALRQDTGDGSPRQRFRQALIVVQVAASALLIFWSGLFARSMLGAGSIDPGFDPDGVLVADLSLADDLPGAAQRQDARFVELAHRVSAYPGVSASGWSSIVPLAMTANERFRVARGDAPPDDRGEFAVASRLGPGWFATVRIPLLAGRDFAWSDAAGAPLVAIVNETLARKYWNGNAVGETLRYGDARLEIVGVVRDSKYWTIGETIQPQVYLPIRQSPGMTPTLHIRTDDPGGTAARLRADARIMAPGTVPRIRPMRDAVSVAVLPATLAAAVTGSFGVIGAFLATLGVYGLISYIIAQRTKELAIRRAIGARTSDILRVVGGGSLKLTAAGLTAGLALGTLSAPLLGGLLVNVSPRDPLTLAFTALAISVTAVLACVPSALRAMRIDPASALKAQ